jgi:hypothetical protein
LRVILLNANQQLLKVATVSQGFRGPVHWNHINLTDDYSWRQNERVEKGGFRALRFQPPGLAYNISIWCSQPFIFRTTARVTHKEVKWFLLRKGLSI